MSQSSDEDEFVARKRQRVHSALDTSPSSSSSSSSSDEFDRAPDCLDDLPDFRPAKVNTPKDDGESVPAEDDASVQPQVEFYDFSSILKSQEELKTVAGLMAAYTEKQKETNTGVNEIELPGKGTTLDHSSVKPASSSSADKMDVEELLRLGENLKRSGKKPQKETKSMKLADIDESILDDFVVVEDEKEGEGERKNPSGSVDITITVPNALTKKKKERELKQQIELARQYNECRRAYQANLHRATLLGCLSHGFHVNALANSDLVQGLALSIVPTKAFYPPAKTTIHHLEYVTKWFHKRYHKIGSEKYVSLEIVVNDFMNSKPSNATSLVVMFVAMCRQLGFKCRLLMSLQPCPLKPPASETMKIPKEAKSDDDDSFLDEKVPEKCEPGPSKGKKRSKKSASSKNDTPTKKKKNATKKEPNRKVVSSDSDEDASFKIASQKKGMDVWAEVYIETDKIWVPADVARGQVNNIAAIGNGVTKPIRYVVGWNADGTVKDLTRRYSPFWLTTTPKLRTDPDWWKKALAPWAPLKTKMEDLENKKLDEDEAACPIPTTINECKNHPFYAMARHLLKYEAIYPPDAKPIGFIRGEGVYSRLCVTELHTKERWMREGKAVKVNEKPYKIVKARPKWDKLTSQVVKDLPLSLYGYWQVADYIAPPAINGIVPKNDYGNVELYRPSMLPAGTVHLQVPGMAKIAKKLGIDFAPAVTGWEYHGGSSHPQIDGVIVCEEHQDVLLDAWNNDIDEAAERQKTKAHTRAVKNWKKLIRSVIIRRRLEKKYNLDLSKVEPR